MSGQVPTNAPALDMSRCFFLSVNERKNTTHHNDDKVSIFNIITQPSIYGVTVYFLLCHESLNY